MPIHHPQRILSWLPRTARCQFFFHHNEESTHPLIFRKQGIMELGIHIASRSQVLQNYKFLDLIFRFLDYDHNGQRNLLRACLTCKAFLSPALQILCRSMGLLRPSYCSLLCLKSRRPKQRGRGPRQYVAAIFVFIQLMDYHRFMQVPLTPRNWNAWNDALDGLDIFIHALPRLLVRTLPFGLEKTPPDVVPRILLKHLVTSTPSMIEMDWISSTVQSDVTTFLHDVTLSARHLKDLPVRGELSMSPYAMDDYPRLIREQSNFLPVSFVNLRGLELDCLAHLDFMFLDASSMDYLRELTVEFSNPYSDHTMVHVNQWRLSSYPLFRTCWKHYESTFLTKRWSLLHGTFPFI